MADLLRWARDRRNELEDVASRAWDQVNMLDNGRTWQQRTPTSKGSVGQQIQNSAPVRNAGRAVDSVATAKRNTLNDIIDNFSDILDANSKADIAKRVAANQPELYQDQQLALGNQRPNQNLGQALFGNTARLLNTGAGIIQETPATIREAAGLLTGNEEAVANAVNDLNAIQEATRKTKGGVLNAGTIYNSPTEKLNPLDTAKRFIPAYAGAAGETFPVPAARVFQGTNILTKAGKVAGASGVANTLADSGQQLAETGRIDPLRSLQAAAAGAFLGGVIPLAGYGVKKGFQATDNAAMKAAQANPAMEYGGLNNGARNNLDLNMDAFKARKANKSDAPPPKSTVTKVASLTDQQMVDQMVTNLGLSKPVAERLVKQNNKPVLFENLYRNKDYIKGADSPDAYATSVMKDANRRGQAAKNQGAPTKTPVKYTKAGAGFVKDPEDKLVPTVSVPKKNITSDSVQPVKANDGNMVNPVTGELVGKKITPDVKTYAKTSKPTEKKPLKVVNAEGQPAKLSKITETFFDNHKGNKKINYPALEQLGKSVTQAIDDEFAAIGKDAKTVIAKVQAGARNPKVTTLQQAGLTAKEASIIRRAQAEFNYVRRRASLGKKEVGEGDFGELYWPQQKTGQYKEGTLFEGFRDVKPGNENVRKNKIKLQDLDNDTTVAGEYITRYGDTKLYQEERIARALEKNNPNAGQAKVEEATKKLINLQNRINALTSKIGLLGLGRRKNQVNGVTIDTAKEMSDLGRGLGKEQIDVDETPGGLTNGDRVNSVDVAPNKTLAHYLGLNQHRDSTAYANSQVINAKGDRTKLMEAVRTRLTNEYDLPEDTVAYLSESIGRMKKSLPIEVVKGRVESTYQIAAKQQLMENLQKVNIKDKTLSKDVSDLTNQYLRQGTIEREMSAKAVSAVLQTTNAIFRKLNVSSSLNELSDLTGIVTVYGRKTVGAPDFKKIEKYGLGDIDPAIEPYIKQIEQGGDLKTTLSKINNATNLYRFVETYKAGVLANTAEKYYTKLSGDALTKQILKDYRDLVLPVDEMTKTIFDNAPLYTQYMSWGARNLQKEGRLLSGRLDSGIMANKSMSQRIARDLYANLPAKTVFWLTSNALKGTAILTAFGLTDYTGLTNQDFSGIQEKDKSAFDKTTQFTNTSTTFSLLNSMVQTWEKEQLKNKKEYNLPGEYNPYKNNDVKGQVVGIFTPQAYKNVRGVPFSKVEGAQQLMQKGYSESKDGRIQYEAPKDPYNTGKAFLLGKGNTTNAREYSGRKNILDRVKDGQSPLIGVRDMAAEQLDLKETNYNRPLNKDYSKAYKEADGALKTSTLDGGRKYNKTLDDLKKNNRTAYDEYINSMDGNHVSPEFWRNITGGTSSDNMDLKTFHSMRDRKKQLKKDMDKAGKNKDGKFNYDPIYDLEDTQARQVLEQKSATTGSDLALRNILYKEQWYKDYMAKSQEYYKNRPEDDRVFKETPRVKEWNSYNESYNALTGITGDTLQKEYPLVWQLKQFPFGSQEGKNFLNANYDAWKAQNDAADGRKLELINKMRKIEGQQPMSLAAYQQATEVADTDSSDSKSGGYARGGSSNGGGDSVDTTVPKIGLADTDTPKIKVKKLETPNFKAKTKKLSVKKIPGSYLNKKLS